MSDVRISYLATLTKPMPWTSMDPWENPLDCAIRSRDISMGYLKLIALSAAADDR